MKKILKTILLIVVFLVVGFIALLAFVLINDYKPEEKEIVASYPNPDIISDSLPITLLTWNIGYAGLDKEMDFFYDGGTRVFTPEVRCRENINEIGNYLKSNDTIDFIILQEVDLKSKRSYKIDEYKRIAEGLPLHASSFAKNYDVFFVPSPISEPMGKVLSGIATFSKYKPETASRISLPGDFGFPMQLFYLDRCFLISRFKVSDGKELVVINTHNEAFDGTGNIRKSQMEMLRKFVLNEYKSGKYVIAGGDWNQYPPNFLPAFPGNKGFIGQIGNFSLMGIESDFMPEEWKWIYDPGTPSFRTLLTAYSHETTPTSVCDFFLISPNIDNVSVKCQNLGFTNSDHNPIIMEVRLSGN